jgi:2,3-bisphosphoglycerate-independent phosphoglycerate mutase
MLKYDVVIGRTTNNPGTAVDVNALEITLYKSEELDFGVFTIPATTRFENYQILDRVDITVTDGSTTKVYDPFLVISDEVTPVSKKGLYRHTVTFIEDIHKFEKILSGNVFITQPLTGQKKTLLDVMNHIRDVVPFERASFHSANKIV